MKNKQTEQENQDLLKELYNKNQEWLNKAIFSVSTLAIPFLFEVLSKEKGLKPSFFLLFICLTGFVSVILLQLSSLRNARDGCDKLLSKDQREKKLGNKMCDLARKKDICRECIFAFSLILSVLALFINNLN